MRLRLFLVFAALFLAACGGSSEGDTPKYNRTDATNPLNVVAACKAADLEASVQSANRSGADLDVVVRLSSKSDSDCTVSGFPGINLYNEEKTSVPATVSESDESKTSEKIKKGESTYFDVIYSSGTGTNCSEANFLYVTPPGDDQALHLPLTGDQVLRICGTATAKVSPLRAAA